jgi:K+-transporting ATPase A subunit
MTNDYLIINNQSTFTSKKGMDDLYMRETAPLAALNLATSWGGQGVELWSFLRWILVTIFAWPIRTYI